MIKHYIDNITHEIVVIFRILLLNLLDYNSSNFAAAVNLPPYSSSNHSNLFSVQDAFNYAAGNTTNKLSNSYNSATNQNDCGSNNSYYFPSHIMSSPGYDGGIGVGSGGGGGLSISPSIHRLNDFNPLADELNVNSVGGGGSLAVGNSLMANNKNAFSLQSLHTPQNNNNDLNRLTIELMNRNAQILKLSARIDDLGRKVIQIIIKFSKI